MELDSDTDSWLFNSDLSLTCVPHLYYLLTAPMEKAGAIFDIYGKNCLRVQIATKKLSNHNNNNKKQQVYWNLLRLKLVHCGLEEFKRAHWAQKGSLWVRRDNYFTIRPSGSTNLWLINLS